MVIDAAKTAGVSPIELVKPLTSIRFFAAMAVVMFHSGSTWVASLPHVPQPVKNMLHNGYVGVTFFFVLSGFILQFVYSGPSVRIGKYAVARFARVYPVYLIALLAVVPFYGAWGWDAIPQFLLLQTWPPAEIVMGIPNWNMPAWTLSIELVFYLVFPVLCVLAHKAPTRMIGVGIAATALFIILAASSTKEPAAFLAPVPVPLIRLPEFLFGLLWGEMYLRTRGMRMRVPAGPIIVAILIVLSVSHDPLIAVAATLFSGVIFFTVAHNSRSLTARVLSWRPIVLLGAASYSLYLFQMPVRAVLNETLGNGRMAALIQYPALIAASVAIFLLFEEPVREWIRRGAHMRKPVTAEI